jgi:hypothetical protein
LPAAVGTESLRGVGSTTKEEVIMRWLVLATVALAALAAAAFAVAGPAGQGAGAYALVNPNGGSPVLVDAHTSGFTNVTVGPFGPGDYCLTPSPGVNVDSTAAVVSVEAFYTNAFGIATVRYPTTGPSCPTGQLEVKTFTDNPVQLSDQIGFTVNLP